MAKLNLPNYLTSADNTYVDSLYQDFVKDPSSVEETWRKFFEGFEFGLSSGAGKTSGGELSSERWQKELSVFRMIQSFRTRGHLLANTNPVRARIDRAPHLTLEDYQLTNDDLQKTFTTGSALGLGEASLSQILDHLKKLYCSTIGLEFMHCDNTEIRKWVRERFESTAKNFNFTLDKKKRILQKLNEATAFEQFLQAKFVGQKRFSLEGGESAIPALDTIINKGTELGAKEFVIGMAHRGRLNVLANIVGKTYEYIFNEFEGSHEHVPGSGDVKYHMGYTSEVMTSNGQSAYVKLLANPSHLETVGPVAIGFSRAISDVMYAQDFSKVIPIIIHGDAAVAGQGVVYESLQMSKLKGYNVGGSIHLVINNQIGFTTDFSDGRSSAYSTSVGRMLDMPILHVNGDDVEAVVYAMEFAVDFRQKFNRDIFIDMVCYRKYGHNEGDEPRYTQPHLYGLIAKHKHPREIYIEKLLSSNSINTDQANSLQEEFKKLLDDRFNNVKQKTIPARRQGPHKLWSDLRASTAADFVESPNTAVKKETLEKIIKTISSVPSDFKVIKKAEKVLNDRRLAFDNNALDWATAELLAYGSILLDGNNIRFTGQDVVRGTFSHRHAKVFDEVTNDSYSPLDKLSESQGKFYIYNSLLSEYAVLGFEYGYSFGTPRSLTIWEAQFGDFSNGAQIVIDQYISACETKWNRMSGLVMLLPHGHEGQGPEHSSARPERYLQMCAEHNMVIINASTPANMFHALRRQLAWEFRKPLIVMTPKSLLRDPRCVSPVAEIVSGKFQEVYEDNFVDSKKVTRVIFCTGKVYYDLLDRQQKEKRTDVAIIRIEQLYPLPALKISAVIEKYKKAEMCWVQEEPKNQGYWNFLRRFPEILSGLCFIGRKAAAAPATGFASTHKEEQLQILDEAFAKTLNRNLHSEV
jgi:2-oxoglutarate dehydrogenase E1 component